MPKFLAIVKIPAPSGYFADPANQENVILRYYSALRGEEYTRIDNCLGCIKLRWAVNEVDDPWVDVQPVHTIRGRVHVDLDGMHLCSEAECSGPADMVDTWTDILFYINRFKFSDYECLYMLKDIITEFLDDKSQAYSKANM